MIDKRVTVSVVASALTLLAGTLPVLAQSSRSPEPVPVSDDGGSCAREIEGVRWFFDPCVPEGAPLPPDVLAGIEEDRLARICVPSEARRQMSRFVLPSLSTLPSEPATTSPAPIPSSSAAPSASPSQPASPSSGPSQSASPSSNPSAPGPQPSSSQPQPGPSESTVPPSSGPTNSPVPCPPRVSPEPIPTDPEPTPTPSESTEPTPQPSVTPSAPQSPMPIPSTPGPLPTGSVPASPSTSPSPTCAAPTNGSANGSVNDDTAARLAEADKDKICVPNRNPSRPVVVVATGDSVTASHFQLNHYHVPKKCSVRNNTASDHRRIPGADMNNSYVGQYVNNINRDVVDYYNFARTGFTTQEIIAATRTTQDACENDWARAYPPLQLAEAAVAKAKRDGRIAYHVTTGGINNTNWSQVAAGVGLCGMAKFLRLEAARAWRNLPLNPVLRYYDPRGRGSNESDLIKGGACQLVVQIFDPTTPNPREITHARLRFDVPVYDGATHLPQITRDVNTITTRMVAAGADKVVWMGYYDLTPAQVNIGTFAAQYIQNTNLPDEVKGLVPNLPNVQRELIPNPDWKRQAQAWTADLNQAIRASILPNDPIVRFQPAPALTADQIQKTMIGGCPHPNIPGHGELAKSLDTAIRAGIR